MQVELFIPCFIDQFFPETGFNLITLLERVGCKVSYNPKQTCCGQPSFNAGYIKETKKLADKFIKDFTSNSIIVSPGGSCTGFIKNYYPSLYDIDKDKEVARNLGNRMYDITDFLVNVLKITDVGAIFNNTVTIHDSCSAIREYGLKNEPRILLSNVKGLQIIELDERETCCGFGGTFSMKHSAISTAMVEQKVRFALETGAKFITSTEGSCLMNIAAYIKKNNVPITPIHIVDILVNQSL